MTKTPEAIKDRYIKDQPLIHRNNKEKVTIKVKTEVI